MDEIDNSDSESIDRLCDSVENDLESIEG